MEIAILLDTSGSMEGLIDQAKTRLWKIVNDLALAKKTGQTPNIQVALYEYGKSSIPASEGYLKMIVPLTADLDRVSEGLFSLHLDDHVYEVLCTKGDLIGVPDNTRHWFDMGPNPNFVAIRIFTNPAGWVADFTGSDIAQRFPRLAN